MNVNQSNDRNAQNGTKQIQMNFNKANQNDRDKHPIKKPTFRCAIYFIILLYINWKIVLRKHAAGER